MKTIFDSLISTLNAIEVRGKDNLDRLLGCILTIEKLRDMITTEKREIKPEEEKQDDHHDGQGEDV